MKTKITKEIPAAGLDQRWLAGDETATEIVNCRLSGDGFGWVNDIGWEPLIPKNAATTTDNTSTPFQQDIDRVFVWTRHNGSEVYYIEKSHNGGIHYRIANQGTVANIPCYNIINERQISPRQIAKSDEADEQFIPFGDKLLIINGSDQMLKFAGRQRVFPFGFTQSTPSPKLSDTDPEYIANAGRRTESGAQCIGWADTDYIGVGQSAGVNNYRYKVSFITDTGSESPLSDYAQTNYTTATSTTVKYGIYINDLPIGPAGTVKRRIYRTKNLKDLSAVDVVYYHLTEIEENVSRTFMDTIPDVSLITEAPTQADSVKINNSFAYGCSWGGSVWLGGGAGQNTRIIYSKQGLPEQFPAFNYFDLGNTQGGAITALYPYYDNLLVFRENGIDVIRSRGATASGRTYSISTLVQNIGTTATNSIVSVPAVGVMFMSYDGVYCIKGGTIGGSSVVVEKISQPISKELNRMSANALARVSSSYSHKEKEVWFMYPVDGETVNTRHAIFHTLNKSWSTRHKVGEAVNGSWAFNDISCNPAGWFILAPRPLKVTGAGGAYDLYNAGLQVFSRRNTFGNKVSFDAQSVMSETVNDPEESIWASAWLDFGSDVIKKKIHTVEIEMLTKGHNEVQLSYAVDGLPTYTVAQSQPVSIPEKFGTSNDDTTFGASTSAYDKSVAVIDNKVNWAGARRVRIRFDLQTGDVGCFRWKIQTLNLMQVVSYRVTYNPTQKSSTNIKAGR